MKKRLIAGTIIFLGLILIAPIVYDRSLDKNEGDRIPSYLNSHPDIGYFKINPETILISLADGKTDVFTPLDGDPGSVESLTNISFSWTQADILEIITALGQSVWNDKMDLTDWSVYDLYLRKSCSDDPNGFDFASITYFKAIDVNGRKVYTTRHIEIDPYGSMIRWGSGATYPRPILHKWKGINLAGFTITAEDALRILDEHVGKEARQQVSNKCLIFITTSPDNEKWYVNYISTGFAAYVDPFTGEYEVLDSNNR